MNCVDCLHSLPDWVDDHGTTYIKHDHERNTRVRSSRERKK